MILDPLLDIFRGKAVTIPPMDGALRPNTLLDAADVVATLQAPDNLVESGGRILCSSGNRLVALEGGATLAEFSAPISALATTNDLIAVGLASGAIEIRQLSNLGAAGTILQGFNCPAALTFDGPDTLYICNGSETAGPAEWKADLMRKGATGSIWQLSLADQNRRALAKGLAFPFGLTLDRANKRIVVAESWRHRLIAIPIDGGRPTPVLDHLAGYPARLSPRPSGGHLLAIFAPRNRLIEYVLIEDAYRTDMMAEIDSEHWIAPSLSASRSFLEPLQSGGVRSMGIHKPWSPSRSYGLVALLDASFQPTGSIHSRANGTRHGITSAIETSGKILAASKGGDVVLSLPSQRAAS